MEDEDASKLLQSLRGRLVQSEVVYNNEMQQFVELMNRANQWTDLLANPRVKTHAYTTEKVKACSDRLLAQAGANKGLVVGDLYNSFATYLGNGAELLTYCTQLQDMRAMLRAEGSSCDSVATASYSQVYQLERALLPLYRLNEILVLFQEIKPILVANNRRMELSHCDQVIEVITKLTMRCMRLLTLSDGCSYIHSLQELFDNSQQSGAVTPRQIVAAKYPAVLEVDKTKQLTENDLSKVIMKLKPVNSFVTSKDHTKQHSKLVSSVNPQLGTTGVHSAVNKITPKIIVPRQTPTKSDHLLNERNDGEKSAIDLQLRPVDMHSHINKIALTSPTLPENPQKTENIPIKTNKTNATDMHNNFHKSSLRIWEETLEIGEKCPSDASYQTGRSVFYKLEGSSNFSSLPRDRKTGSTALTRNSSLSGVTKNAKFKSSLETKLSTKFITHSDTLVGNATSGKDIVQEIEFEILNLDNKRKNLEEQLATARNTISTSGEISEKRDSDYCSLSYRSSIESLNATEPMRNSSDSEFETVMNTLQIKDSHTNLQGKQSLETKSATGEVVRRARSEMVNQYDEVVLRSNAPRSGTIKRWKNTNMKVNYLTVNSESDVPKHIHRGITRSFLRNSIRHAPLYQSFHEDGRILQRDLSPTEGGLDATGDCSTYQNVSFKQGGLDASSDSSTYQNVLSFKPPKAQENISNVKEDIMFITNYGNHQENENVYETLSGKVNYQNVISNSNKNVNGGPRAKNENVLDSEHGYMYMGGNKGKDIKREFRDGDGIEHTTNGQRFGEVNSEYVGYVLPGVNQDYEGISGDSDGLVYENTRCGENGEQYSPTSIYESVHDAFANIGTQAGSEMVYSQEQTPKKNTAMKEPVRWCNIPEVKASGVLADCDKRVRCLQEAKYEIISSKVSYLKSLSILQAVFIQNEQLSQILPKDDWESLFQYIAPIKRCSEHFLADLLSGWPQDLLLNNMATVINQYVLTGLQVYVDFCSNNTRMNETLKDIRENKPLVNQLLKQLEADEVCENLPLESFLISPIKRVMHLPLLVNGILCRLTPGGKEHTAWTRTLDQLQTMAVKCDEAVKEAEAGRMKQVLTFSGKSAKNDMNSLKKTPQLKKVGSKKRAIFFRH